MIAVVIPCYRVRDQILGVIRAIGPTVERIYVVDDAGPERTADLVESAIDDPRVRVLRHEKNLGVGGATMTGYEAAVADGATVIVKLDGDGQMDPARIPQFTAPIESGEVDYVKGNRFYDLDDLKSMPTLRLVGNSLLSFITKASSGYWDLFDPTNGYTAIHAKVAARLPYAKISKRYFFESDLLFRLNTMRATARDVPMPARYGAETSSLVVSRIVGEFLFKHLVNAGKRIFYNYYLRNFSIASIELVLGVTFLAFGTVVGVLEWIESARTNVTASSGTVMLAALPVIIGIQLLIAFLTHDMQGMPVDPLHRRLPDAEQPR
jgi:glycosyltransferase involved in cell wall biosynthesis